LDAGAKIRRTSRFVKGEKKSLQLVARKNIGDGGKRMGRSARNLTESGGGGINDNQNEKPRGGEMKKRTFSREKGWQLGRLREIRG